MNYHDYQNVLRRAEYERRKVLTPFERRAIREEQRRKPGLATRVVRRIMNWRKP